LRTLFPANYNWGFFLLAALFIRVMFVDMSTLTYVAALISIYQFSLLFNSIGYIIPTRHLLGSFMCLQFLVGSLFAYNGIDQYQYFRYQMRIPEADYYFYVMPAVIFFIIGLHINAGKYRGEVLNRKAIANFVGRNPQLPYFFIILGFLASVISSFFSSELAFVFYLLGSFKFIGLFLLVLGTKYIKPAVMALVIGSIISSSLQSGMFHDLLTWLVFTIAIFGIKYKFDFKIKLIGLVAFVLLAILIQVLKGSYRAEIGKGDEEGGVSTFSKIYEEQNREDRGIFNFRNIASSNTRINQGFIITNIMQTVPDVEPFANGSEMYKILEAAILPRILAPDKLRAGDREIFRKYSGIGIQAGTSMALSSIGDAYVNWGIFGGVIFMFVLGFVFSEVLNYFHKYSMDYPILILFVPLVFYYPIRPDCELQTSLGHLIKSCVLIYFMVLFWKKDLRKLTIKKKSSIAISN